MKEIQMKVLAILDRLAWVPLLVARITIGMVFVPTGWGKLHDLPKVVEFFQSLGIPYPQLQAPFVASVELGCGLLVLLGLFTRVAAVPLIGTMVVAIMTAQWKDLTSWTGLFGLSEFLYIVLLMTLIHHGAGLVSLDRVFFKRPR